MQGDHDEQGCYHGHEQERDAVAGLVVVHLALGSPASLAAALDDRSHASRADQVFAAHQASPPAGPQPVTSAMLDLPDSFPP